MTNATTSHHPFDPAILLAQIESLSHRLEEQQQTINDLKEVSSAESNLCPGKVVYKSE